MTTAELIARVYLDLAHPSVNNDRLPPATILGKLNDGYVEYAKLTKCFNRAVSLALADAQNSVTFPQDFAGIVAGSFTYTPTAGSATAVRDSTVEIEAAKLISWRSLAKGVTSRIVPDSGLTARIVPPAGAVAALAGSQHCIPFSCGGGIASITRAGSTVTVVTNGNHGLAAAESVSIHGVTGAIDFELSAMTVLTVPTTASFTFTSAGTAGSGTAATGVVSYAAGKFPLVLNADVPAVPPEHHQGLAGYAVAELALGYLLDEQEATVRAEKGRASFVDAVMATNARIF